MFDTLANDLATRFGLGDKANPFLRMLLAHMTDPDRGGLGGFVDRLRGAQWNTVDTWLGKPDLSLSVPEEHIERAFGSAGGLVAAMVGKLGVTRDLIVRALAFAVPALLGRLTPSGALSAAVPTDVATYIGDRREWILPVTRTAVPVAPAAPVVVERRGGGWWPWVLAAVVAALALGWCSLQNKPADSTMATTPPASAPEPTPVTPAPAPEPTPPATAPAPEPTPPASPADAASIPAVPPAPAATDPATSAVPAPSGSMPAPSALATDEPAGAGVVTWRHEEMPALKVYFDSGSTVVAPEFNERAKELADHMAAHPELKAAISGFNDPTGDPVKNAELAKNRADAVKAALVMMGVNADRLDLRKPAETTGTATTNAASRRVEVTLIK